MSNIFVTPSWFFGYDVVLEVLFAIITFMVSYYAWKTYKITQERNIRLFSYGFFFISVSYITQTILNFIILAELQETVSGIINLQSVYLLNLFGIYTYALLFLVGLLILTYVALRIYSIRTFILLFLLVFTSLYFSNYKTFTLYLLSTTLLAFIVYYYVANYWNNRKITTLLVAVAMITLFLSHVYFIFAIESSWYYVVGHLLELVAYSLVLINLTLVSNLGKSQRLKQNGKKKR